MQTNRPITVSGAPEGYDARLVLAEVEKTAGPVIHVARDDKRLAAMQAALAFFDPSMPVVTFPAWDCLPYDRVSPNADVSATRMATLAGLAHGMPDRFVLLTTLNAATQKVPARDVLREAAAADLGPKPGLVGVPRLQLRLVLLAQLVHRRVAVLRFPVWLEHWHLHALLPEKLPQRAAAL